MKERTEIIRESAEARARQVWVFNYFDWAHALYLISYKSESRPTKRHNWRLGEYWFYLDERGSKIKAEAVPLPFDVMAEARAAFMDSLKIEIWKGRG